MEPRSSRGPDSSELLLERERRRANFSSMWISVVRPGDCDKKDAGKYGICPQKKSKKTLLFFLLFTFICNVSLN